MSRLKISTAAVIAALALTVAADIAPGSYGVNIHFMWEYQRVPKEFMMLKQGGINWVRSDFCWNYQEKSPGKWDFSRYDAAMGLAAKNKLNVLPILTYAPKWNSPAHKNIPAWLDYVRRNLKRYGSQINTWEIWNEHNYGMFWPKPNPDDYLSLLKPTSELIRSEAPGAKIILGGTSQIPMQYIEKLFKGGGGNYFDVMNVHPYNWYDAPEFELGIQIRNLRKLMEKYNISKDIWITETGWPTHQGGYAQEVFPTALAAAGINVSNFNMAVVNDNEYPILASSPGLIWQKIFPGAKEIRSITLGEIKKLDPKKCPVLVPCPSETFVSAYFKDLEDYIRKGGTVIFPRGIPLYSGLKKNADGSSSKTWIDKKYLGRLHIAYDAWWLDKSKQMPKYFKPEVAPEFTGKIKAKKLYGSNSILSDRMLKGNDKMITLIRPLNSKNGGLLAVYKFDSDLKGAVIAGSTNWIGSAAATEEMQARLLPRMIIIAMNAGVKKIFWYEFQAPEQRDDDQEHHFGICHNDLTPKPAWHAYTTLAKMRPVGSSIPELKISKNGVYIAHWIKPDNQHGWAVWVPGTIVEQSFLFTGKVTGIVDCIGNKLKVKVNENKLKIQVSNAITYIDGPKTLVLE